MKKILSFLICIILVFIGFIIRNLHVPLFQPEAVEVAQAPVSSKTAHESAYELPALRKESGEQILRKTAMTISYNKEWRIPNWVAYELTADETEGEFTRSSAFFQDEEVDEECRVSTYDYSRSGYDRGHMAPAADFRWSEQAMRESFLMTNICPQNHELNTKSWQTLEKRCRKWAVEEGAVYIAVGPIVFSRTPERIGDHRVVVPDAFFKVVLSLRSGQEKAIGFIYQNNARQQRISRTACSVDEVEQQTGLDFFVALPDDLEERLEARFDLSEWAE